MPRKLNVTQQAAMGRRPPQPAPVVEPVMETTFVSGTPVDGCSWLDGTSRKDWSRCDAPVYGRPNPDGTMHWYPYCKKHHDRCYIRRSDAA